MRSWKVTDTTLRRCGKNKPMCYSQMLARALKAPTIGSACLMHYILSFPISLALVCILMNWSAVGADSSTNEESCVQPSPQEMAKAVGVTLPKLPWHVVNIWWDFAKPTEHFESLAVDVSIDRDVPATYNLYISPCGLGKMNGQQFYGGLQSNINGWANATNHTRVHPGKGAIFSRWSSDKKTPIGLEHVR